MVRAMDFDIDGNSTGRVVVVVVVVMVSTRDTTTFGLTASSVEPLDLRDFTCTLL